jgi:hypothetical protein
MKVRYKRRIYHVQWPKRFDEIILRVAKTYRCTDGTVSWKEAEADGMLRGLPIFLNLRNISQRNAHLKSSKNPRNRRKRLKRNQEYVKTHPSTSSQSTSVKQKLYAGTVPEKIKKKYGWKPRSIWTEKQKKLLLELSEKYRKSKVTIDWIKLAKDKRIKKLPFQGSFKLCKYYNSLKRKKKGGKKFIVQRRKDALIYKYDNYDVYLDNQEKRRIRVKDSVNEFLLSKLELR